MKIQLFDDTYLVQLFEKKFFLQHNWKQNMCAA